MTLPMSTPKVRGSSLAALAAVSLTVRSVVRVFAVKLVTRIAMSLAGVIRSRRFSPKQVLSHGDSLKMVWIATQTVSTQVVDSEVIWNGTFRKLVSKPVGICLGAVVAVCGVGVVTVPGASYGSSPRPALAMPCRSINLHPETNGQWNLLVLHAFSIVTRRTS